MQPLSLDDAARLVAAAERMTVGKGRKLDLRAVAGPVEINPANLTATFLAGTPVAEIQAALAPHGLCWPVDGRSDRTLGAVVATAGPYPGRSGYGPVRDWVLGLEVILTGGLRMRLGGQTMKNVAGYDLARLFVGSRGTLGAIGSATLRLLPRPERQATAVLPRDRWPQAIGLAAACEWDGQQLLIRVDGRSTQVERRLAVLGAVPTDAQAWTRWYGRAGLGRYVRRETPDWAVCGAPALRLWQEFGPIRYSPLELELREAIDPGRCFQPDL